MWRFIDSLKPPVAKKPKSSDEIKDQQLNYENTTRKRTFQDRWLKQFPWLTVKTSRMICSTCLEVEKDKGDTLKGTFVTGSSNFKIESLKHHELSQSHKDNVIKQKAKKCVSGTCTAELSLQTLSKSIFDKMCKPFRNAHGLAKQGRPYSDFSFICDLDEMKGVNIGQTYRNDKSCRQFVYYIAEETRSSIRKDVENASFLSIISDGATDTAHSEREILYTRFCHQGVLQTHFTCIKNIGKADAEAISTTLSDVLTDVFCLQWKDKLIGRSQYFFSFNFF